jgi:hypothetical protein
MRALFINVGQGDCTLLQRDGYSILCDAGTEKAIASKLGLLRAEAPRLDLIVGTHYDADHLTGLARVVEEYPVGCIGEAWLPPFLNPDGEIVAGSPFLAHRIERDGLAAALSPLEGDARRLPSEELDRLRWVLSRDPHEILEVIAEGREELKNALLVSETGEAIVPLEEDDEPALYDDHVQEVQVKRAEAHADARWSAFARPESEERVTEAIKVVEKQLRLSALAELMKLGGEINTLALEQPYIAAKLLRSRSVSGSRALAAMTSTVAAVNGVHLEKLLTALHRRGVRWSIPLAPAQARWRSFGAFEIAHLSPTSTFVDVNRARLPVMTKALYDHTALSIDAELPSWSNRLSHALAVRPARCWCRNGCGVLLTGDCAFWRSVSTGAEEVVGECAIVDVAHHGGRWGRFREFLLAAQATNEQPRPLFLWLSTKHGGWRPPGPRLARLVRDLSGNQSTWLLAANRPDGRALEGLRELTSCDTPPQAVGMRACMPYFTYCHWGAPGDGFSWDASAATSPP